MPVVINRTRKDSCENARVLLLLVKQSRCTVRRGHATIHRGFVHVGPINWSMIYHTRPMPMCSWTRT